ncbi:hypothetical protein H4S07_000884 [Coemansia furcata]|uniref:Uncharacterized protein n=1 Tax=Coemansia furcata TaxID=417177 RepID=A0ACC1LPH0_9FUNG|nr:hypothetical protein H4S07_000884 [Coemansia furcata]
MGDTDVPAAGQQRKLVKRLATTAITGQKGAILFSNGKPTSCEVALVSNLYGYVAANCLSYAPDGSVDMTKNYQVMISDGTTTSLGMFGVYSATPHFKYDHTSFANNVAMLKFNAGGTRQWKNYIGANRSDWSSKFYVSRAVANTGGSSMPAWLPTQAVLDAGDVTSQCASASPLFASNMNDLLCTAQVTTTASACALPYSSIYGIHDPNLAIAALYSHSVIIGDSLCKYTQIYNYYTVLSNYLEWGGDIVQSTIYLYVADFTYINNNNPNYSMVVPSGKPSGLVVGGDLSGNSPQPNQPSSSSSPTPSSSSTTSTSTSTSTSATSTSSSPSSSPTSDASAGQNTEKKGINIGIILLIVGLVLLVIAIIAYLLYRRYKKRKEQTTDLMAMDNHLGRQSVYSATFGYNENNNHLNAPINTDNGYGSKGHY